MEKKEVDIFRGKPKTSEEMAKKLIRSSFQKKKAIQLFSKIKKNIGTVFCNILVNGKCLPIIQPLVCR